MSRIYRNLILFSIVLISGLMHFNHFSKDLMSIHVWRQTQTQSTIINFYEEDMNILHPRRNDRGNGDGIFKMEFPLMQWLVACAYKIFGNHLIITRLIMFIIGLFSILGIYILLKSLFQNEVSALMGAWAFNFSPCFYYYTINPLPDNLALCSSIWGIAMFFYWYRKRKIHLLLISALLLSMGALCKLPFILYFSVPLTYFVIYSIKNGISRGIILKTILTCSFILLPLAWYLSVIPQWGGNGIIKGIMDNKVSFPVYFDYLQDNLISTLPELLLNYGSLIFFLAGFYFIYKKKAFKTPLFPLLVVWSISILMYFLFELNMIAKIHDYYLFPFYPILFILVSYGAYNLFSLKVGYIKYLVILLLLILPITAYLRMQIRWRPESPGFNKDLLVYKEELRNAVPKSVLCIAGNDESHFIFFYYIDKKGWGFHNNELNAININNMIKDGAKYLYSDSRTIDDDKNIQQFLNKLILEKGSIRIYSLKQ
jgi:hypothetical protein